LRKGTREKRKGCDRPRLRWLGKLLLAFIRSNFSWNFPAFAASSAGDNKFPGGWVFADFFIFFFLFRTPFQGPLLGSVELIFPSMFSARFFRPPRVSWRVFQTWFLLLGGSWNGVACKAMSVPRQAPEGSTCGAAKTTRGRFYCRGNCFRGFGALGHAPVAGLSLAGPRGFTIRCRWKVNNRAKLPLNFGDGAHQGKKNRSCLAAQ